MHGNEPVLLAFVIWLALITFGAMRSFTFWTARGPARIFRSAFFFAAIPWLAIWAPALIGSVVLWITDKYPLPASSQLIQRFSENAFDIGLGLYALIIPALAPLAIWSTVRAKAMHDLS